MPKEEWTCIKTQQGELKKMKVSFKNLFKNQRPGVVAHAYNPRTLEGLSGLEVRSLRPA